jgi:hypothetical protein
MNLPFDVAVEEPDTGVIGAETQDDVPVWADEDGVAPHGCVGWGCVIGVCGVVESCVVVAAGNDLEGVAVEVEGVSTRMFRTQGEDEKRGWVRRTFRGHCC